jgi:hypothetical protein
MAAIASVHNGEGGCLLGQDPDLLQGLSQGMAVIGIALTATQRRDLMEIVEERCGRSATMITSQLPITAWHDVIGEPTFADAILDRIVHNAYRLELEGASMRKTIAKTDDETPET